MSYTHRYTPQAIMRARRSQRDVRFKERRVRDLPAMIEATRAKLRDLQQEAELIGLREFAGDGK